MKHRPFFSIDSLGGSSPVPLSAMVLLPLEADDGEVSRAIRLEADNLSDVQALLSADHHIHEASWSALRQLAEFPPHQYLHEFYLVTGPSDRLLNALSEPELHVYFDLTSCFNLNPQSLIVWAGPDSRSVRRALEAVATPSFAIVVSPEVGHAQSQAELVRDAVDLAADIISAVSKLEESTETPQAAGAAATRLLLLRAVHCLHLLAQSMDLTRHNFKLAIDDWITAGRSPDATWQFAFDLFPSSPEGYARGRLALRDVEMDPSTLVDVVVELREGVGSVAAALFPSRRSD